MCRSSAVYSANRPTNCWSRRRSSANFRLSSTGPSASMSFWTPCFACSASRANSVDAASVSAITALLAASEALTNWTSRSEESPRASDSCSSARLTLQPVAAMTKTAMVPTRLLAMAGRLLCARRARLVEAQVPNRPRRLIGGGARLCYPDEFGARGGERDRRVRGFSFAFSHRRAPLLPIHGDQHRVGARVPDNRCGRRHGCPTAGRSWRAWRAPAPAAATHRGSRIELQLGQQRRLRQFHREPHARRLRPSGAPPPKRTGPGGRVGAMTRG